MLTHPAVWAFLILLVVGFYLFVGWLGARVATEALPPADLRQRASDEALTAASDLLSLQLPATDEQIKAAARKLLPRAPGDYLDDGTPKIDLMPKVLEAQYLLLDTNAFDANPPYAARDLLGYWNYRAGVLGRLWARLVPPAALQRLHLQAQAEQTA